MGSGPYSATRPRCACARGRPLLAGGLAASLLALEPALLARPFPTAVVAVAAALGFGGSGFSNALWFTALQERIPRQALSRVSSYDWLGSIAFQPAGFALAGPSRGSDRSVRDAAGLGGRSGLGLHRGLALAQRPSPPRSLAIR